MSCLRARASNSIKGASCWVVRANGISRGREAPEALAAVYRRVGNFARVLGIIDEAKVISPWLVVSQVRGEKWHVKFRLNVVKECQLLFGCD